jgi:hypothetical protein
MVTLLVASITIRRVKPPENQETAGLTSAGSAIDRSGLRIEDVRLADIVHYF